MTETVSLYMEQLLYEELFECEVEPYDDVQNDRLRPSQLQFIQGMLNMERQEGSQVCLTLSNDGAEYLLHVVLPEHLERWYAKMDAESDILIRHAEKFLNEYGLDAIY